MSIKAVLFDFKLPDFNLLHLNWHALGVLFGKYCEISFQPIFLTSFKWRSSRSSWGSQEEGFLLEFLEDADADAEVDDEEEAGREGEDSWTSFLDIAVDDECGWRVSECSWGWVSMLLKWMEAEFKLVEMDITEQRREGRLERARKLFDEVGWTDCEKEETRINILQKREKIEQDTKQDEREKK